MMTGIWSSFRCTRVGCALGCIDHATRALAHVHMVPRQVPSRALHACDILIICSAGEHLAGRIAILARDTDPIMHARE
jgi:hypothetical protein